MSIAHQRKKQPERVRQQLLEVAARLSLEQGVTALTLDAVSQAAGVSKGGLLHHFRSKSALVDGLFDDLVAKFDRAVAAEMDVDPTAHGRFTRAYLAVTFALEGESGAQGWRALTIALLSEPSLRARWRQWVSEKAETFSETDGSTVCRLVRFAADGVWLADLLLSHDLDAASRHALFSELQAMTLQ